MKQEKMFIPKYEVSFYKENSKTYMEIAQLRMAEVGDNVASTNSMQIEIDALDNMVELLNNLQSELKEVGLDQFFEDPDEWFSFSS